MRIVIKPLVAEKVIVITNRLNRFGFITRSEANKLEIKSEAETLYDATVVSVNIMRYVGKSRDRYTKADIIDGHTNAHRKATVTLEEGDIIDFYSNI